jgi:uncharacterized protein YhjY with autotransporter beta-barrel domain
VDARPDPTLDAAVRGQLTAQASLVRRLSEGQISNISAHLMQLHSGFDRCANRGQVNLGAAQAAGRGKAAEGAWRADGVRTPAGFGEGAAIGAAGATGTAYAASPAIASFTATAPSIAEQADGVRTPAAAGAEGAPSSDSTQDDNRCLSEALFGSGNFALWMGGSIDYGEMNGGLDTRNRFHAQGLTVGLDYQLSEHITGGFALGGGWDTTRVTGETRTQGRGRFASLYASLQPLSLISLDALLGYGSARLDNRRWESTDEVLLTGDRRGSSWFGALNASARIRAAGVDVQPFARVQYVRNVLDAYAEQGDTSLALSFEDARLGASAFASGFSLSRTFTMSAFALTPAVRVGYEHHFDSKQSQALYYSDLGADERSIVDVRASPIDTHSAELSLELSTLGRFRMGVGYSYSSGSSAFVSRAFRISAGLEL